ncbi:MAG: S8 family serine peptidase [Acidobacteria bacterium]|nr:S8 family serine peptidase [Acidobacteriota bacterium]
MGRPRGKLIFVIGVALVAGVAAAPWAGAQGRSSGEPSFEIRLRTASFDPLLEGTDRAAGGHPEALRSLPSPDDLVLIQFDGPSMPEWLAELREEGAAIFDYVPQNAYLARVRPGAMERVRANPFVRAIVPYLPAFRIDPDLAVPSSSPRDGPMRLLLQAAPDVDGDILSAAVRRAAAGAIHVGRGRHPGATLEEIEIASADLASLLPRLAAIPDLLWIEERRPIRAHNDQMKWVLQTGVPSLTRLFSRELTGRGQIVGCSDTGSDVNHCFFTDPLETVAFELINPDSPPAVPLMNPAHRKVLAYQYHSGSNTIDESGHGTHVTGTAVGDDLAHPASGTDPGLDRFDGMAPGARLVFQDVDRSGGFLDVPVNFYGYVQAAYNAGARIHTNSWGADTNAYTSDSSQVDRFAWDHPDMLFTYSAGNRGPGPGTVGAPASAKNVIAVGMTQTPAAGDPNNLESASSNGPTSDGRRKPEVVNVGGFPIRSSFFGTACGIANAGGTSMSTPGVAGGAALVRQYLTEGFNPHGYAGSGPSLTPSAALLKAVVINSAINISGANVDAPIPDNSQGWGRVLLDNALFFPNDPQRLMILRDDDLSSSADGFPVGATAATETYQVFSCRTDVPFKATLVWTEPPVSPTSGQAWVNDLDLEVVTPGGALYRGNVFSGGVSTTGGTADDRNNVEQVLLPGGAVEGGSYTLRVVPRNVAVGPQPYALMVTGDVSSGPLPRLTVTGVTRSAGCDGDPFLDENETLEFTYTIVNRGCGDAASLNAVLGADTLLPVTIQPAGVPLAGLPAGGSTTASFRVSLGATGGGCGGEIPLLLRLQAPDGGRWELAHTELLRLDPASGTRVVLDDVESGDRSISKSPEWQIGSCMASSPTRAWHMGDADCSGIPRDATTHSLTFEVGLAVGESLSTASFTHAFDGYSNASIPLFDSVHFEIDHNLDGTFDRIASWNDNAAPTTMSPAGPYDLTAFNQGRSPSVRFRFRFQSAANWVGGPNNAPGWNVDDFLVGVEIFAQCDVNSKLAAPGDVGDTLTLASSGGDVVLSWNPAPRAATYRVLRSTSPADFSAAETFSSAAIPFADADALLDPRSFFYKVLAASSCGAVSAN